RRSQRSSRQARSVRCAPCVASIPRRSCGPTCWATARRPSGCPASQCARSYALRDPCSLRDLPPVHRWRPIRPCPPGVRGIPPLNGKAHPPWVRASRWIHRVWPGSGLAAVRRAPRLRRTVHRILACDKTAEVHLPPHNGEDTVASWECGRKRRSSDLTAPVLEIHLWQGDGHWQPALEDTLQLSEMGPAIVARG